MNLPDQFRLARFYKKMTQEELARQIGVSRQTILSIEHGKTDPAWTIAKKASHILGFSLDSLDV